MGWGNATQVSSRRIVIKIAMEVGKGAVGLSIALEGSPRGMAVSSAKLVVEKLALPIL